MEISAKPALAIIAVLTAAIVYAASFGPTGFITASDAPSSLSVSVCCQTSQPPPSQAPCQYSCMQQDDCSAIQGHDASGSCPSYQFVPGFNLNQICCSAGTVVNKDTDAAMEFANSILIESETDLRGRFSGLGTMDIFNLAILIETNSKIADISLTSSVLKTVQSNLKAGMSVENTINTYKKYYDPTRRTLNLEGSAFVGSKLQRISDDYRELCRSLSGLTLDKVPPDLRQVRENCRFPENMMTIISTDLRRLEENTIIELANADRNGIITSLKNIDRKTRSRTATDNDYAELYFRLGKYLDGKDDAKAVEMYNAVVDEFPSSSHVTESQARVNSLKSKGHIAKVFGRDLILGMIGGDLVPGPDLSKIKALGFISKVPGINRFAAKNGDDALKAALKTEGFTDSEADEFLQLSKKVDAGTATDDDKLMLASIIRIKTGMTALKKLKDVVPKLGFLGDLDGYDLWKAAQGSSTGTRWIVFVEMDGVKQPFYKSAGGTGGKLQGGWHPFFGFAENDMPGVGEGWFLKAELDASGYGLNEASYKQITDQLDAALPGYWAQGEIPLELDEIVYSAKSVNSIGFSAFNLKTFGRQIVDRVAIDDQLLRAYGIPKAKNFDELYGVLNSWGRIIHGSNGETYTVLEMKNIIDDVQLGNKPLNAITRTGGIRDKVAQLLGSYVINMRLSISGALPHETTYINSVIDKDQIATWAGLTQNLGIRSEIRDVKVTFLGQGAFKRAFKVTAQTASDGEKVFVIKMPRGELGPIDLREFENIRLLGGKGVSQRLYTTTPVTRPYHLDSSIRTVILVEEFVPGQVTDEVLRTAIARGDNQKITSIFRSLGDLGGNLWKKTSKKGADGAYIGTAIEDNHLKNSMTDLSGGAAVTKYVDAAYLKEMNFETFMDTEIGSGRAISDSTSRDVMLDKILVHSTDYLDGMWPHLLESTGGDVAKAKDMLYDATIHFDTKALQVQAEKSRQFYRGMSLKIADFADTK